MKNCKQIYKIIFKSMSNSIICYYMISLIYMVSLAEVCLNLKRIAQGPQL